MMVLVGLVELCERADVFKVEQAKWEEICWEGLGKGVSNS